MLYSPACPSTTAWGYEIYYYAVENTHVNAADFDYLDTAISYTLDGTLTEIGTQSAWTTAFRKMARALTPLC